MNSSVSDPDPSGFCFNKLMGSKWGFLIRFWRNLTKKDSVVSAKYDIYIFFTWTYIFLGVFFMDLCQDPDPEKKVRSGSGQKDPDPKPPHPFPTPWIGRMWGLWAHLNVIKLTGERGSYKATLFSQAANKQQAPNKGAYVRPSRREGDFKKSLGRL